MSKLNQENKIGLALGGGAALGAAHIGVLKALEELEIKVDYISGTSIGAFIGAFHAFNKSWQEIEEIANELKWLDISGFSLSQYGLLSNKKLGSLLDDCIGKVDIEASNIPFAMVATDISNGEKVILDKGNLADAVMASTCIPGIFIPVEIEDRLLVDGGIVENVPVTPLQTMGAETIMGIDLNAKHAYGRPENIIEVLLNSFHFTLNTASNIQTQKADIIIAPDLSAFNRVDIDQASDLIEAGYQETIKVLGN